MSWRESPGCFASRGWNPIGARCGKPVTVLIYCTLHGRLVLLGLGFGAVGLIMLAALKAIG